MTTNPIFAIAARGDHYDIGHALGVASGRAVRERVFVTTEFQELAARWRGSMRLEQLEVAARGAFPTIVRELEGMAAGAVLDFETLFLWNCRGDLRLPPDGVEAEGCMCVLHPGDIGPEHRALSLITRTVRRNFLGIAIGCAWNRLPARISRVSCI